ncbi:helix-turn-helix domain-containing protein [Rhodococcus hoagii]|nr:helix-turn-helix domain-containing protein [Prescottella equi]
MRRPLRGFDPVRLRLAREGAKLSRAELARLTGVSASSYSQWELGASSHVRIHWRAALPSWAST